MNSNLIINSMGSSPNGLLVGGAGITSEQVLNVNQGGTPAKVMHYTNGSGQTLPITRMYYGSTLVFRVDL